jgi:acyl-CoA synthetase (AMP-forming)/AMP-acid ligase II
MLDLLLFGAGNRLQDPPRCVLSAGSPLSRRTAERFHRSSGSYVRPLYGTTETGGITVATLDEAAEMAVGCVGRPMSGVRVRVQADADQEDIGHLWVRSTSMMAGYLASGDLDRAPLEEDWFLTGDLAWLDDTGAIHLKGRWSEVINVGGMKVVPSDVEEVIAALAEVVEVKVYAGRTRGGDQFVKAAVVLEGALDEAAIRAHCERELVYYKCPERIIRVDSLPRSPAGKIVVDQLP